MGGSDCSGNAKLGDRRADALRLISPSNSRPNAAAPTSVGRFITTKPARSKMPDKALRDDLRHDLVGVVDALATLQAQRIGQRVGDVGRRLYTEYC